MTAPRRQRVCLFTAHSPLGGGGGAILRSLVASLRDEIDIVWHYLASKPAQGYEAGWLGRPIIGGSGLGRDIIHTALLLTGFRQQPWRLILEKVQAINCDGYWIVSHNEGLCLARDMVGLTDRPIHLSVHDDWGGGLCAGSSRYRLLGSLADRATDKTLKTVGSVDVVSEGMRSYYRHRTGVDSFIVHRPTPWRAIQKAEIVRNEILVGHLGSIYSSREFLAFLAALKAYCDHHRCMGKVIAWGSHLRLADIPAHLSCFVEFRPTSDEAAIIRELQGCAFVYAMYPFASRRSIFVRTSFPTKLSSYVMAQRPILGHAPENSTLASFLGRTGAGVAWSSVNIADGLTCITKAVRCKVDERTWKAAQQEFFGESNVNRMRKLLRTQLVCEASSNP
jgi:hypothetical protein